MPPLKKKEKIMMGLAGAVLIYMVIDDPYYIIWKSPPGSEPTGQTTTTQPITPGEADAAIVRSEPGKHVWDKVEYTGWGRDPFVQTRRYVDQAAELSDLKLGVISVKGDSRMALINSKPVKEGDLIGGMTVERIEKDRVILTIQGLSYTLTWED